MQIAMTRGANTHVVDSHIMSSNTIIDVDISDIHIQWTTAALRTPSKTVTFTIKYLSKCKYRESFSIGSSSGFGNTQKMLKMINFYLRY